MTRRIMAIATVLRISLAAYLTLILGTSFVSAVNQTASPSTDSAPTSLERGTEDTFTSATFLEVDTFSPEVTTDLAPSVVTSATTALLTELGITASAVTSVDGNSTKSSGISSSQGGRDELRTLITSTDVSTIFPDQNGVSTEGTGPYVPWTPDGVDPTTTFADVSRQTTPFFHKLNFPDPELQLLDGNVTKATVQWFFENQTNINKYIFSYNQTDSYPGGFKHYRSDDLAGTKQHITLYGIYPGARYELNIQAFSGPLSTTIYREWFPETEPPSNVRVFNTTANSFRLEWIFPPHTPPLLVNYFSISCKAQNYRFKPSMTWQTRETLFLVSELLPGVTYGCSVVTVSRNGKSSYPQSMTVDTGVLPPTGIRISERTSSTFTIQWDTPEGNYQHVIVTCSQCLHNEQVIGSGSNTARFEGLKSGIQYNVTLETNAQSSRSDPNLFNVLTLPMGPSSLIVYVLDDIKLQLVWTSNNCQGCVVDFYRATLFLSGTNHQVAVKNVPCKGRDCHLVFDHELLPGQEYRAEVRADRGGLLSLHPVTAIQRIPPAVPGPITFKSATHSLLHMAWTPPRGIVDRYIIGICEADQIRSSTACDTYQVEVNSSITDFRCIKLKTSTRYNITLTAKSDTLISRLRWVIKSTTSHYPKADDDPPKAPSSTNDITPYTFPVTFDTSYFDNSERDIVNYTVLIAEAGAVSHADLPTQGNLTEGLKTRTWAVAIDQETIQRYQIAEHYSYADLTAESGKREAYASRTIVIGEESCSEENKDVYCNGPLKHNRIYVYQFRAFTKTGYSDTPFSRHVLLPEDNTGVVVGISVILVLLFVIVLVLISIIMIRKFRGTYGRYKPAHSMEPLPIRMMTRASTRQRNSRPVLLTDFCHDFQVMNAHCHYGFSQEYEVMVKVGRKLSSNAAVLAANVSKNRYTNILPFDRTRVMLSPVDDVEGSDYINANYIPGYNSPREYIACQGPLPGTVDDTWRMVWEQDVATIVILTQLLEKATVKCDQYWPEDNTPLLYGDIKILMSHKEEMENWCIRDFTLQMFETTKQVRQFHYLAWPDHGVPDSSSTLKNFIHTVREQIPSNGTPTIVHCSAGVGRTGTFICLDRLMRHMEDYNFVDILRIVCDMRSHRNFMVQTEQQYVFIHKCILEILEEKGIAPKRLPSISSLDTYDMNSRLGSDASAIKRHSEGDVIMRRSSVGSEDDTLKRMSMYSMGSPKRSLIEDDTRSRSHKKSANGGSNGSPKRSLIEDDTRSRSQKKSANGGSNGSLKRSLTEGDTRSRSQKKSANGGSNGSLKKCANGSSNGSPQKCANGSNRGSPRNSANGSINGSPKKCGIESSNGSRRNSANASPKKCANGGSNGSIKKHPNGIKTDVSEEIV
ncbi:tyrosine-protein phosphatase 10D-like isoform X2 [Asterias rubens]|uniref:tyrosine-protein phosphatase 10D-like isoform X2 n=1 Tax=Asterias rubens TaxID=7604 RepID=UPI00145544BA|nr:tyrosine-protein phosphatase 10D-like isoform X2 [Asterias rubens]